MQTYLEACACVLATLCIGLVTVVIHDIYQGFKNK